MSQRYRLKHNVGKHYLPPEKPQGYPPIEMPPGTIIPEEEVPVAARDKFELVIPGGGSNGTGRVNNLEVVDEGDGKFSVVHKKTRKAVHDGFVTKSEAEDYLGEVIEDKKKFTRKKAKAK